MPILKEIKKDIAKILNTNDFELIVFGSYARGEAREDSDLDLLVVVNKEVDTKKIKEKIFNILFSKYNLISDVIINTPKNKIDYILYQNIKDEGVKVWKFTLIRERTFNNLIK